MKAGATTLRWMSVAQPRGRERGVYSAPLVSYSSDLHTILVPHGLTFLASLSRLKCTQNLLGGRAQVACMLPPSACL